MILKNPVVCFIGDSITAAEKYTRILVDYFVLHYPEKHIMFHNLGIPGIGASTVLDNWDALVTSKEPTHATVMFGMNDMSRVLYADSANVTDALLGKRKQAVLRFGENIKNVHARLDGVHVLGMTCTPHDENPEIEGPVYKGYNDALIHGNALTKEVCPDALDLHAILSEANSMHLVKTVIGPDRVHPQNIGQAIMAYHILKKLGIEDPKLPLWDSTYTDEEKAVLAKLGIHEDPAPKNPFSDLRSRAARRLTHLNYVQMNVLDGHGFAREDTDGTDAFLREQLASPIEEWRIEAYSDFLVNRNFIPDIEAEAARFMENMYKA